MFAASMIAAALALLLATPGPAPGDPRPPEAQARLADLAEALGRAHALHRLCAGPEDARWRAPMQRLLALERPTPALRDRLVTRFNAGFAEAGARHHACDDGSRAALAEAAARGRDLARGFAPPSPP